MLLVAFSRRMCCSRVCSARRSAGRPAASTDTPTRRPGSERLCGVAGGDERRRGARRSRAARRSAATSPTTTSAPSSPGGVSSGAGRAGRRRRRPARPAACAASMSGAEVADLAARCRGTGAARRTAARPSSSEPRGSPTTTSMPSGSARVAHDRDRLRVAVGVDEETRCGRPWRAGGSSVMASAAAVRLVEQRGVGHVHPGEVADHRSGS